MGDILGGGILLAASSFLIATAAGETGNGYAQLAASRSKTFAAITEPVVLMVVFTVALITTTDLPMDITDGVDREIMSKALAQAKKGRLHILERMEEALGTPRTAVSSMLPSM